MGMPTILFVKSIAWPWGPVAGLQSGIGKTETRMTTAFYLAHGYPSSVTPTMTTQLRFATTVLQIRAKTVDPAHMATTRIPTHATAPRDSQEITAK